MKILIVSQYFWPENVKINDFALGMTQRGHEITVLTGKPNYSHGKYFKGYGFFKVRKENFNGIKIIRTPLISRGKGSKIRMGLNYISFAFFSCIAAIFRINGYFDLIFVFQLSPVTVAIPAILLKKIKKIPIFHWILDLWPESVTIGNNVSSKFIISNLNRLVKYIYKKSDQILISSNYFIQSVKEKGVNDSKIIYFPNWAEDIFVKPLMKKEDVKKLLPDGFLVMFAGNVGDTQDFESIVNAAELLKSHKEIKWVIIGDGRKKIWVETQVKDRKLEETFYCLGQFPLEKMPDFFYFADVMLVSLRDEEIFSLTVPGKVPAYLACKKPILGMINGEGAEIINNAGAGLTCNAGDYKKLAENTLKMSQMCKEDLDSLAQNGRRFYDKTFSREILFDKFEKYYKYFKENY